MLIFGIDGLCVSVLMLVGLILGVMVVWLDMFDFEYYKLLVVVLVNWLSWLIDVFEVVVFV